MKPILRTFVLMFSVVCINAVSAKTVLADGMALFSGNGEVKLFTIPGRLGVATAVFETSRRPCIFFQVGTGVSQCEDARQLADFPGDESTAPWVSVRVGPIAGRAGPQFGVATAESRGQSFAVRYTNRTDFDFTLNQVFEISYDLITQASGDGRAMATFAFDIVDQNDRSLLPNGAISDAIFGNDMRHVPLRISGNAPFSLPARSTVTIRILAGVSGSAAVPEPATLFLLGTGLAGVAIKTRHRLKNRNGKQGDQ